MHDLTVETAPKLMFTYYICLHTLSGVLQLTDWLNSRERSAQSCSVVLAHAYTTLSDPQTEKPLVGCGIICLMDQKQHLMPLHVLGVCVCVCERERE